eukprot:1104778-Amphidinium_carterae.1
MPQVHESDDEDMDDASGEPPNPEQQPGEELGADALAVEEARKRVHATLDAGEDPGQQCGERGREYPEEMPGFTDSPQGTLRTVLLKPGNKKMFGGTSTSNANQSKLACKNSKLGCTIYASQNSKLCTGYAGKQTTGTTRPPRPGYRPIKNALGKKKVTRGRQSSLICGRAGGRLVLCVRYILLKQAIGWHARKKNMAEIKKQLTAMQNKLGNKPACMQQPSKGDGKGTRREVAGAMRTSPMAVLQTLRCKEVKDPKAEGPGVPVPKAKAVASLEGDLKKHIAVAKDFPALQTQLQIALQAVQQQKQKTLPLQQRRAHLMAQARSLADKMDLQAKVAQEATQKRNSFGKNW